MGESDFLFARPSFFEGVARVIDLGNTLNEYNSSKTPAEADARALKADWDCVGKSIRDAMKGAGDVAEESRP